MSPPEQETPESVRLCKVSIPVSSQAALLPGSVYNRTAVCREGGRLHQASKSFSSLPIPPVNVPFLHLVPLQVTSEDSYSNLRVTGSLKYSSLRLREGCRSAFCPSCLSLANGMRRLDVRWQGVVPLCVKFFEEVEAVGWTRLETLWGLTES